MINILEDSLRDRKQRVVLNGQCSSWVGIRAGVHKDPFWDICYLQYMSTIYKMILKVNVNCLLMTHLCFH